MQLQATQNLQLLYLSHSWSFLINAGKIKTGYSGLCEIMQQQKFLSCGHWHGLLELLQIWPSSNCWYLWGISSSGVARISKLGAHRWRGPKGRCGGGFFGEASAAAPPHQLGGLGRAVTTSHCPAPSPKNLIGFARILWLCLSTVGGVPPPPRGYAIYWSLVVYQCPQNLVHHRLCAVASALC